MEPSTLALSRSSTVPNMLRDLLAVDTQEDYDSQVAYIESLWEAAFDGMTAPTEDDTTELDEDGFPVLQVEETLEAGNALASSAVAAATPLKPRGCVHEVDTSRPGAESWED